MGANTEYTKIKESTISAFFSKLKAIFWPKADVVNIDLGDAALLDVDNAPTASSDNLVKSGGVYTALQGKQDTLTFDNAPTASSNNPVKSGGVYSEVHPAYGSSQPSGGMLPNVLYKLGTLTGAVTISLASPSDATIENEYKLTFTAGSTAPTITWDNAITEWMGNCLDSNGQPVMTASKSYEISVKDGLGIIIEW